MKTKLTLVLIVLVISLSGKSQSIYSQYFDGADTSVSNSIFIQIDPDSSNIWQVGPPQKTIFNSASTTPNAILTDTLNHYPINNNSSFSYGYRDNGFFLGNILAFQWVQKLDMDLGLDGGVIEFSTDSGNSWVNAFNSPYVYNFYGFNLNNVDTLPSGDIAFTGTDSAWRDIWLCFDMFGFIMNNDSLIIRHRFTSDSIDNGNEGWLIDNISMHPTIIHTIDNKIQDEYMLASPNPTSGRVHINTKKLDEYHVIEKIELITLSGKIVQKWGLSPTKFYVDLDNHPDGNYILKVTTNIKTESFRIQLKH